VTRLMRWLLIQYLDALAGFSANPRRIRKELSLLSGSVEVASDRFRRQGDGELRSILRALWSEAGELQPLAVMGKIRAETASAEEPRRTSRRGLVALALGGVAVAVIMGPLVLAWVLLWVAFGTAGWMALRLALTTRNFWSSTATLVVVLWPLTGDMRDEVTAAALGGGFLGLILLLGRTRSQAAGSPSKSLLIVVSAMPIIYLAIVTIGSLTIDGVPRAQFADMRWGTYVGEWVALVRNLQFLAYWSIVGLALSLARRQCVETEAVSALG